MRIIRTGGTNQPQPVGAKVAKGWVREGILSWLATRPSTLTDVSRTLGVSKSTASYHLSLLVEKGAVEVVDSRVGRGGAEVKLYGLREGSQVTLLSREDEEAELTLLRETFDLEMLSWQSSEAIGLEQVQRLLYRMFLHLFRISKSEHSSLMREYGASAGAVFAGHLPQTRSREALSRLAAEFARAGLSDADVMEIPETSISVLVSNVCLGSASHTSNACHFLEGMVEGAVREMAGPGVRVGRVNVPGVASCLIAVGRVKRFEQGWLAEAVLTSSSYAAINRRRYVG